MADWTLTEAKQHLSAWLQADLALATSKEYTMGNGRKLTRADANEVAQQLRFWRNEVNRLESGRNQGARIFRAVPRDL